MACFLEGFAVSQKEVPEGVLRKPPSLRRNNGSIQIRVRVNGENRLIHRLGKWSDPGAVARAQALSAQIWSDFCSGCLDPSLERYHHQPLQVQTGRSSLLDALEALEQEKRQGRVTHAYRLVKRYGKGINSKAEGEEFVEWMEKRGLAASTRMSVLSTIRVVHPRGRDALKDVVVKVPHRCVLDEVLSTGEIQGILKDLEEREPWFYPVFAVWLGTGLRNAELIGLCWENVRWEEGELRITRSLRRDGSSTHRRVWGPTKTGRSRIVPMSEKVQEVLQQHQRAMGDLGLDTDRGLVFVTPRSHGNLYDSGLEQVWKRSQRRVGIKPRRLYAQRHSFLSHALAMGNSPADLAQIAGHRVEMLLNTYAKPTGRVLMPSW